MTKPRSLLLLNYEYPPVGGGAANATQFLGREFRRLGHRVYVLTSGLRDNAGITEEDGLKIQHLPIGRAHANRASVREMLAFLVHSWRAMAGLHREHHFDGAIAFFTIPCGPAALRLHQLGGVPCTWFHCAAATSRVMCRA